MPDVKKRSAEARQLCRVIEEAFSGVLLGEGVGLREGLGLDNWEDKTKCASYRALDEQYDWSSISAQELNRCSSSLSYFDAEGMRFHLPAFMICELNGDCENGMDFCLTHLEERDKARFALLSTKQRIAVRMFLLHIAEEEKYMPNRERLLRALNEYWTDPYLRMTNRRRTWED